MRYLLYGILIYFLLRLIFNFIIPVYKTTVKVKEQFRDLQQKANEQNPPPQNKGAGKGSTEPSQKVGEYIDFEDIK
ncbi:MAG: hypothetical protein GC171_15585 [Terrimonas sp.]|nr:hypothetical protein [Terrimonas sp.]